MFLFNFHNCSLSQGSTTVRGSQRKLTACSEDYRANWFSHMSGHTKDRSSDLVKDQLTNKDGCEVFYAKSFKFHPMIPHVSLLNNSLQIVQWRFHERGRCEVALECSLQ